MFLEMISGYVEEARREVSASAEGSADKVIKRTFYAGAEKVLATLGLYQRLVSAIGKADSDPRQGCSEMVHLGYDFLQRLAAMPQRYQEGSEARGIADLDFRMLTDKVEQMCRGMGIGVNVAASGSCEVIITTERFTHDIFLDSLGRLADAFHGAVPLCGLQR